MPHATRTYVCDSKRNAVNFVEQTFRLHSKRFYAKADTCCDLLICDEAHRLKNADTATNQVNPWTNEYSRRQATKVVSG